MDTLLVERARAGDRAAFAVVADRSFDRFRAVAHRILRDVDAAEDAAQKALITIWQELPRLRDAERFEAWAYRILVRACTSEARRARRWLPNILETDHDLPAGGDDLATVMDRDQLERGFRHLTVDQRSVLVLYYFLDLPLERIADVLEVPVGTARSRLYRALDALRAALDAGARRSVELTPQQETAR
jgi:RNA polymerase sigma-70 factor (ECF subfamily)